MLNVVHSDDPITIRAHWMCAPGCMPFPDGSSETYLALGEVKTERSRSYDRIENRMAGKRECWSHDETITGGDAVLVLTERKTGPIETHTFADRLIVRLGANSANVADFRARIGPFLYRWDGQRVAFDQHAYERVAEHEAA